MFNIPLRHQTLAKKTNYITIGLQTDCYNVPKWCHNDPNVIHGLKYKKLSQRMWICDGEKVLTLTEVQ